MAAKEDAKIAMCEMCHSRCRVLVHAKNGEVVKVEGDRTYPLVDDVSPPTNACRRLQGIKEWVYHPDRLNFPLKRVGEWVEGSGNEFHGTRLLMKWPKGFKTLRISMEQRHFFTRVEPVARGDTLSPGS